MEAMTIQEILQAVQGELVGDIPNLNEMITCIETDSRTIHEGSLFVPIVGERFDGHAYIDMALEKGAMGCLTQNDTEAYRAGKCYIKVASTYKAFRDLAYYYKQKFPIPVVALTGSVGKTTTKDMVAAVLGEKYNVLKTQGNLNNDLGVPMTLFNLDRTHELAVLELGMNHPGEIDYLSEIVEPDIALITNVGDSHIEFFGSREGILKTKAEIFNHAKPTAFGILNGDDELLCTLDGNLNRNIIWCGGHEGNGYRATDLHSDGHSAMTCQIHTPKGRFPVEIPALGEHMIYPTLMAVAVGEHFGMTAEEMTRGIASFAPTKMRMDIINRGQGITILNDTYNANPQSMGAALEVLSTTKSMKKVAVLGDMFELGSLAPSLHAVVGDAVGRTGIDCLVAVGELSQHMAETARKYNATQVYHCPTKEEAHSILADLVHPNTTFLVKASRGMALEELVEYLKEITVDG